MTMQAYEVENLQAVFVVVIVMVKILWHAMIHAVEIAQPYLRKILPTVAVTSCAKGMKHHAHVE